MADYRKSIELRRFCSILLSTPVTVLTPIKRDKLTCTCDHCETRKFERQRVGFDRSERLRIHQEQQKFVDPMKGASQALIERLRELKSYDLDTAKQEQRFVLNGMIYPYHSKVRRLESVWNYRATGGIRSIL